MEKQLIALIQIVEKAENQVVQLENDKNLLMIQNESYKYQYEDISRKLEYVCDRNKELENSMKNVLKCSNIRKNDYESVISDLQSELKDTKQERNDIICNLDTERDDLRRQNEELKRQNEELKRQNEELKSAMKSKVDKIQKENKKKEKKNVVFKLFDKKEHKKAKKKFNDFVKHSENEMKKVNQLIDDLKYDIFEIEQNKSEEDFGRELERIEKERVSSLKFKDIKWYYYPNCIDALYTGSDVYRLFDPKLEKIDDLIINKEEQIVLINLESYFKTLNKTFNQ
jgi:myosin heavy subunit